MWVQCVQSILRPSWKASCSAFLNFMLSLSRRSEHFFFFDRTKSVRRAIVTSSITTHISSGTRWVKQLRGYCPFWGLFSLRWQKSCRLAALQLWEWRVHSASVWFNVLWLYEVVESSWAAGGCSVLIRAVLISIVIVLCAMAGGSLIILAGWSWASLVEDIRWNLSEGSLPGLSEFLCVPDTVKMSWKPCVIRAGKEFMWNWFFFFFFLN